MNYPITILGDAGHGDDDSGAVSHDGKHKEKDIALKVTRLVIAGLSRYEVNIAMTRDDDSFLTLSERARMANRLGAKLLSIHLNSGGGTGFECFTSPGQTGSDLWATHVLESYSAEFPELPPRFDFSDGDADKEARFTVLTKSDEDAILMELGFIDMKDIELLVDPKNQQRMANAIVKGTVRRYNLKLRSSVAAKVSEPSTKPEGELTVVELDSRLENIEWQIKMLRDQGPMNPDLEKRIEAIQWQLLGIKKDAAA